MSTISSDQIFDDYLSRLRSAAQSLPADQSAELIDEIAEHLAAARAAGEADTTVGALNVLERLGDPQAIVASVQREVPDSVVLERPLPLRELLAAFFLTFGSILLVVGWIAGLVFLWTSRRLSLWYKVAGTLLVPLGPYLLAPILVKMSYTECTASSSLGGADTQTCVHHGVQPPFFGFLLMAIYIAPMLVASFYLRAAFRVARTEAPRAIVRPTREWGPLELTATLSMTLGWFILPGLCLVIGLCCAWASKAWTRREKSIATAIAALSLTPILILVFVTSSATIFGRN
jgi:uncharacterized membrane protein